MYLYLFDFVEYQSSLFVPLPAYQTWKTTEACEDVAGSGVAILMFVTAFFLCFIVMFRSFIPGIRRKSKRDVCDVQRYCFK